jgi:hypothetical protein
LTTIFTAMIASSLCLTLSIDVGAVKRHTVVPETLKDQHCINRNMTKESSRPKQK